MKILVCGGRFFTQGQMLCEVLNTYLGKVTNIITGGANGADEYAKLWADINEVNYTEHLANWKKYGKAAGPIRNRKMLEEEEPDLVIAFPGGRGTQNMISLAKAQNYSVIEIS